MNYKFDEDNQIVRKKTEIDLENEDDEDNLRREVRKREIFRAIDAESKKQKMQFVRNAMGNAMKSKNGETPIKEAAITTDFRGRIIRIMKPGQIKGGDVKEMIFSYQEDPSITKFNDFSAVEMNEDHI